MSSKLTIISSNQNKIVEFERLLGIELERIKFDLPEIQEVDVRKVSRVKAEAAYSHLASPVFVDDTGLTIEEWGGLPGALIKWFIDDVSNEGILKMLEGFSSRKARVTTALGYCDKNGVQVFTGELQGSIAEAPRGENGFGYDTIFIPEGSNKTFAEMTDKEKDKISMRAVAAKALSETLPS